MKNRFESFRGDDVGAGIGVDSISFIIPAYNEENALRDTVSMVIGVASTLGSKYEIIVVNDGSIDNTALIADQLVGEYASVRVVHHTRNKGLGAAYKSGLANATSEYVMLVPGDNAWPAEALEVILKKRGQADVVIPYIKNAGDKTAFRKFLSSGYTRLVNLLFGLDVPYYNGIVLHKTRLVRTVPINTDHFSYQTEALVRLIRQGHSFVAVESDTLPRRGGESKAVRLKNLINVLWSLARLLWDVRMRRASSGGPSR